MSTRLAARIGDKSLFTHYAYVSKVAFFMLFPFTPSSDQSEPINRQIRNRKKYAKPQLMKMFLIPGRHGEKGNALREVYHLTRHRWQALFHRAGWKVKRFPGRLFYTSFFGVRHRFVDPVPALAELRFR